MAYRTTSSQLCTYGNGIKAFNQQLQRSFSASAQSTQLANVRIVRHQKNNELLLPSEEFPLPGRVVSQIGYNSAMEAQAASFMLLDGIIVAKKRVEKLLRNSDTDGTPPASRQVSFNDIKNKGNLEMSAVDCPKLLKDHVARMFVDQLPTTFDKQQTLTVLNLTQKSSNDMSAWSVQMELEREQLTLGFVESATTICAALRNRGYWADFIDPASGRPYLGKFTNHTLFETDDYYNLLGFQVEDLGCCKVIKHMLWGTHAFIGTIFTNAPIDCAAINEIRSVLKGTRDSDHSVKEDKSI
jgi:hypothetical protein